MRLRTKHAVFSVLMVISCGLVAMEPATAVARIVSLPNNFAEFPKCSDANASQMCVSDFQVDSNADGTLEDAMTDSELSIHVSIFDKTAQSTANLGVSVQFRNGGELPPRLPVGSLIKVDVNTRDWRPSQQGTGSGKLRAVWQEKVNDEWITHIEMITTHLSLDNGNGGVATEISQSSFNLWDSSEWGPRVVFNGMWIASNAASVTWPPLYDANTMTWTIDTSGPALNSDDTSNVASFQAFFPDAAVIAGYGADPNNMAGSFKAIRQDGSTTKSEQLVITRVTSPIAGILLEIPAYSFSSNQIPAPLSAHPVRGIAGTSKVTPYAKSYRSPRHIIKPAKTLLSAPKWVYAKSGAGKKALLRVGKVTGANSYLGVCIKGSKIRYGTSKTPNVAVPGLTNGTWNCRVRAVKQLGGKPSVAKKVTIK